MYHRSAPAYDLEDGQSWVVLRTMSGHHFSESERRIVATYRLLHISFPPLRHFLGLLGFSGSGLSAPFLDINQAGRQRNRELEAWTRYCGHTYFLPDDTCCKSTTPDDTQPVQGPKRKLGSGKCPVQLL